MAGGQRLPDPDYVVICSENIDWKAHAEIVANHGKTFLLMGTFDPDNDFILALRSKYGLSCHLEHAENKLLLWDPRKIPVRSDERRV